MLNDKVRQRERRGRQGVASLKPRWKDSVESNTGCWATSKRRDQSEVITSLVFNVVRELCRGTKKALY